MKKRRQSGEINVILVGDGEWEKMVCGVKKRGWEWSWWKRG